MIYEVDKWNNFCRVFELPDAYPKGFCFHGGLPVNFKMVDFFEPVPDVGRAGVSKEVWEEEVGPITTVKVDINDLEKSLIPFLLKKNYVKQLRQYLIIYSFGASSIFDVPPTEDQS